MYEISKRFDFAAAHSLQKLPNDHPCSNLHGHNYQVILTLQSEELNETDMVKDYRQLDDFKRWLNKYWDHQNLNDVLKWLIETGSILKTTNSTSENMAKYMYDAWKPEYPELYSVTIKETDKTSATYYES